MSSKRDNTSRVVVTGLGVISPLGIGLPINWARLIAGESGIGPVTRFDASAYSSRVAGEVKDFAPEEYLDKKQARRMDRFSQFGVVAAREALRQANLEITDANADRVGVILGTSMGGMAALDDAYETIYSRGPSRVSPFFIPMMLPDLAAGQISIVLGARGPNWAPVSACATGAHAIGEGAETIRRGAADVILAGGAEAPISRGSLAGYASLGALTDLNDEPYTASRPFDKTRRGFVLAEGAGVLVLERADLAIARGAQILADVSGYGATGDAHHIVEPSPGGRGAVRAMRIALAQADLQPGDIDYLNAHGTSTLTNDRIETAAIKETFGTDARRLSISSTKGATGHALGAGGAIEAAYAIMAMRTGIIPPTVHLNEADPDCDLDYVPNQARTGQQINAVMSNSFGFGGHNGCVVLTRPGEEGDDV